MLIFMEYCEDGTIAEISKIGLPEEIIRVYTLQIVKAVRFIHVNGIVHRDIKGILLLFGNRATLSPTMTSWLSLNHNCVTLCCQD